MKIEQIPADEVISMTDIMHRAFNAAGCDPECHCCEIMIKIGENFKLATVLKKRHFSSVDLEDAIKTYKKGVSESVESLEVMLCADCTPQMFHDKVTEELAQAIVVRDKPKGGCFRVNGIIIH